MCNPPGSQHHRAIDMPAGVGREHGRSAGFSRETEPGGSEGAAGWGLGSTGRRTARRPSAGEATLAWGRPIFLFESDSGRLGEAPSFRDDHSLCPESPDLNGNRTQKHPPRNTQNVGPNTLTPCGPNK